MLDAKQITDDLRDQFRGRLHFDRLTRGLYATDASPFQIEPHAVAVPEDAESVATLVRYCHDHAIPIIPRGAGTGLAGESLGPGVVLDLSVHFRRIVAVGSDTVTVQAGVVLNQLNAELAKTGRRFAPEPGQRRDLHARRDGRHERERRQRLPPRLHARLRRRAERGVGHRRRRRGRRGVRGRGPGVRAERGHPKRCSGTVNQERGAHRAHADAHAVRPLRRTSSTASCPRAASIWRSSSSARKARSRSSPRPRCARSRSRAERASASLGFPTLDAAVRAGLALRRAGPVACDLLDRRLLSLTRGAGIPDVGAALLVVFEADTEREATERAWGAIESLQRQHILRVLAEPTCDPDGVAHVRAVRDAAVSGLYALDGPRPVAFVEDVGVPADALPEFLTRVQDILKRFETTGTFLVHALTGQVHTRPLLDLNDAVRPRQTLAAGGGDSRARAGDWAARSARSTAPASPARRGSSGSTARSCRCSANSSASSTRRALLNPGKIVGPDPSREAWPLRNAVRNEESGVRSSERGVRSEEQTGDSVLTPHSSLLTPLLVWKDSPAAEVKRCNGCGDCRTRTAPERMCPTFRATGHEHATPRAMANMLRVLADPTAATPDEVREVAELCVNCKMCRDECDAKVNVPKLMLEAKARQHAEHGLERGDWVLARAEGLAGLGSNFAPLTNALLGRRSVRWLMEKLFGLSRRRRLPAFSIRTFFRRARGAGLTRKQLRGPESFSRDPKGSGRVALFVDVFAAYNDPAHWPGRGRGVAAPRDRGVRPAATGRQRGRAAREGRPRHGPRARACATCGCSPT